MNIGVPKEIKAQENRVSMVPGSVAELVKRGHRVLVERGRQCNSTFCSGYGVRTCCDCSETPLGMDEVNIST